MSSATLSAVKNATVFIKTGTGSGSGFVIRTEDDEAWIVTNHHVLQSEQRKAAGQPFIPPPHAMIAALKVADFRVVFDSGTKSERSLKAEAVALDPRRDLAVLHVSKLTAPPRPIDLNAGGQLQETLPVFTFGFPFGEGLAIGDGNPAVTVGRATVSSLRENDDGDLARVQLDGAVNPGNSGGPVVDAQGRLVGVAVAQIRSSGGATGIAMAIPAEELRTILRGRLGDVHRAGPPDREKLTLDVEVGVIDPFGKITSVTMYYLAVPPAKEKSADDGPPLSERPGVASIRLTPDKHVARGTITISEGDLEKEFLLQAEYVAGDEALRTPVRRTTLNTAPPPVVVTPPRRIVPPVRTLQPKPRYIYSQTTGRLQCDDQTLGVGYSGRGDAKNDPAKQAALEGPIPAGEYMVTGLRVDPRLGLIYLGLLPKGPGVHLGRFPGQRFGIVAAADTLPPDCWIVVPREVFDKLDTKTAQTSLRVEK
jgi:S1-C subfamily serine protease